MPLHLIFNHVVKLFFLEIVVFSIAVYLTILQYFGKPVSMVNEKRIEIGSKNILQYNTLQVLKDTYYPMFFFPEIALLHGQMKKFKVQISWDICTCFAHYFNFALLFIKIRKVR